ncbi:hypothetical protein [Mesorhizobium sp.]|uniref:hypothetical protein n=1 Tax=Mesorhizobium sp. TaxID=1871066 RepID=UPI0025FC727D|nr:hypothetical protein [Mesorhizobium sp.]
MPCRTFKRFTVLNVAQCDGLPEHLHPGAEPLPERERSRSNIGLFDEATRNQLELF